MLTVAQRQAVEDFEVSLNNLESDALIDAWHEAKLAHDAANAGNKDEMYLNCQYAELAAIKHLGLGEHLRRLEARHPDEA